MVACQDGLSCVLLCNSNRLGLVKGHCPKEEAVAKVERPVINWTTDSRAEDVLEELGIRYDRRTIQLGEINWRKTDKNCGRLGFYGKPVSEDNIEDYAQAMLKGDRFPSPIAANTAEGIVIPAGVHRTKAAIKAGATEIVAYVFDCQLDYHLRMVAILTNRKEGVRVTQAEAMEYAIDLVTNYSMLPKDVAKLVGVNLSTLDNRLRVARLRRQLVEAGHRTSLSDSHLRHITRLQNNIKVLTATVKAIESCALGEEATKDFVKVVTDNRTEADQLSAINKEEERILDIKTVPTQTGAPSKISLPIRSTILRAISMLRKATKDKSTLSDLQMTQEDADNVRTEWAAIKKVLNAVIK